MTNLNNAVSSAQNPTAQALAKAMRSKSEVRFSYTDLSGKQTKRNVVPEEFIAGLNGDSIVGVDKESGERRRFIISSISL